MPPIELKFAMKQELQSEHCRHHVFRAHWQQGATAYGSLFESIYTTVAHRSDVLVPFADHSAMVKPTWFQAPYAITLKAETHNHPTAIHPFSGAATGVGGEIRDLIVCGRGAEVRAGISGHIISSLHTSPTGRIAMDAPLGVAHYANQFGRPLINGFFRTYFSADTKDHAWGFHKPILFAAGIGLIQQHNIHKQKIEPGTVVVHLGNCGSKVGLQGASGSSTIHPHLQEVLVPPAHPSLQNAAARVIETCARNLRNPILSMADLGAGGLATAIPELLHQHQVGAVIDMQRIPYTSDIPKGFEAASRRPGFHNRSLHLVNEDCENRSQHPCSFKDEGDWQAVWLNEAQERFIVLIAPPDLEQFQRIAMRENCPLSVIGHIVEGECLRIQNHSECLDISISELFQNEKKSFEYEPVFFKTPSLPLKKHSFDPNILIQVLEHPSVGSKAHVLTIADRTVGGLTVCEPMVGPWQVPVADCGIVRLSYDSPEGVAVSVGERAPLGKRNSTQSVSFAVAESLLNLAGCHIDALTDIYFSANWMLNIHSEQAPSQLFEAVHALTALCNELNIPIVTGKDSLSMQTEIVKGQHAVKVEAPFTCVMTAIAALKNAQAFVTPVLNTDISSHLFLFTLADDMPLGGSIVAELLSIDEPMGQINISRFKSLWNCIQTLHQKAFILACHDVSDGGVFATLAEMQFASRVGLCIDIPQEASAFRFLTHETPGIVVQIAQKNHLEFLEIIKQFDLEQACILLGQPEHSHEQFIIQQSGKMIFQNLRATLEQHWFQPSYHIINARDGLEAASRQQAMITSPIALTSSIHTVECPPFTGFTPKIAILRAEGTTGHVEMSQAFQRVGFECIDVHLNDVLQQHFSLKEAQGLALCGGFTFSDKDNPGWMVAQSILNSAVLFDEFSRFFENQNTFTLGVCNGAQILSHLKSLIAGSAHWPTFQSNRFLQFESRWVNVKVVPSPSILLQGLEGEILPVPVAHQTGCIDVAVDAPLHYAHLNYPYNPSGSVNGNAGFTSDDGRITALMPHPERALYPWQLPASVKFRHTGWYKLFYNALKFVKTNLC